MLKWLTVALCCYCAVYAFEGAVRYGLNLFGGDALIFVRDAVLLLPLAALTVHQVWTKTLHPAFWVYLAVVLLHGLVFILNFGLIAPAVMGAKVFLTTLTGAIASPVLMRPSPRVVLFFGLLWMSAFGGVALDKLGLEFPWVGLTAQIGDVKVDIGRDWQIEKDSAGYRAGGFMRSSIHAANLTPLLALLLLIHLRRAALRVGVALLTVLALYWTTQKGALLAFLIVLAVLLLCIRKSLTPMRLAFVFFLCLMVALPLVLPGYYMPDANAGGFSNYSFNLRVEMMWPEAWAWIRRHEVFPFGVGLGGISGAQVLYAPEQANAADNLFVFMYAYFGVMAVVYLGLALWAYLRVPASADNSDRQAMVTLLLIVIYGCVLSMLEDQMTSLFLGAALGWLAYERRKPWSPLAVAKAAGKPPTRGARWRIGLVKPATPEQVAGDAEPLPAPVNAETTTRA